MLARAKTGYIGSFRHLVRERSRVKGVRCPLSGCTAWSRRSGSGYCFRNRDDGMPQRDI